MMKFLSANERKHFKFMSFKFMSLKFMTYEKKFLSFSEQNSLSEVFSVLCFTIADHLFLDRIIVLVQK